jgi:hypothetical protein
MSDETYRYNFGAPVVETAIRWADRYAEAMTTNNEGLRRQGRNVSERGDEYNPPDLWTEWWEYHDHYETCNGIGCNTCLFGYTLVRTLQELERLRAALNNVHEWDAAVDRVAPLYNFPNPELGNSETFSKPMVTKTDTETITTSDGDIITTVSTRMIADPGSTT